MLYPKSPVLTSSIFLQNTDVHPVNILYYKDKSEYFNSYLKKSVQQTPQLMDASLYQVSQQMRANLLYSESVTTYTPYSSVGITDCVTLSSVPPSSVELNVQHSQSKVLREPPA